MSSKPIPLLSDILDAVYSLVRSRVFSRCLSNSEDGIRMTDDLKMLRTVIASARSIRSHAK